MKNEFIEGGKSNSDCQWGILTVEKLLRSLYENKKLDDMSEDEVNQMLEDLL